LPSNYILLKLICNIFDLEAIELLVFSSEHLRDIFLYNIKSVYIEELLFFKVVVYFFTLIDILTEMIDIFACVLLGTRIHGSYVT